MTSNETLEQAARQALEALQCHADLGIRADKAINALRQALEQPKQEPFEYWNAVEGWVKVDEVRQHFDSVGCGTIYKTAGEGRVPLYTEPPKRKPLADEEIGLLTTGAGWSHLETPALLLFARAIEAAHGIGEKQ